MYSFKVEGRIKGASYVHTVIDSFRKQIDGFLETGELLEDGERLYKVFNRDFSNAFLRGDLNQSMFIDNPRDNSKNHAIEKAKHFNFDLNGAVMASDAFFPFPDCVEIAHKAGINSVLQPGGSIKDQLSIDYCNENYLSMIFTGTRHFKH